MDKAGEYIIEAVPVAPLKIAAHVSASKLAALVNEALLEYRRADYLYLQRKYSDLAVLGDFVPETFLLDVSTPRFGTGEGKGVIKDSVRGVDEFIIADITNYSNTYTVSGHLNHMSPDDNFQDLKRIIGASVSEAHRVNVVMPFLYESRQHKRSSRESLDCAMALEELTHMGVKNIITFDAHDPRVQNAIPLSGFDSYMASYAFVRCLLERYPDLVIDRDHLMVISPDEGAMRRALYLANNLSVDLGMFYKRRDYSRVEGGRNPIVAHEFLGTSVAGKTVIIVDDMVSSGESMLDTVRELKDKKAGRVIVCCTFGLFTSGFDKFDESYEKGYIDLLITTNLNYKPEEIYLRPWYMEADLSRYLATIINTLNCDQSVARYIDNADRIQRLLSERGGDRG